MEVIRKDHRIISDPNEGYYCPYYADFIIPGLERFKTSICGLCYFKINLFYLKEEINNDKVNDIR